MTNKRVNEINELLSGMQHSLFATKDSIQEAMEYAYTVIDSGAGGNKAAMYTVIHVLMNTVAEEVKHLLNNEGDE